MLSSGRQQVRTAPIAVLSGAAVMLAVLGFNLLADGLHDIAAPRLRT